MTTYLPGMGRHWLLPVYDPLVRLLGLTRLYRSLVDQAGVRPGHRVLEIGCGTGNLLLLIKGRAPWADVVGLDPDPRALGRARRKARRRSLTVRLDEGFAGTLPYPDASFDHVFSSLMFHHLDEDEKVAALREVRRVLRPGGSLHLLDLTESPAHGHGGAHGHGAARVHGRPGRLHAIAGDRIVSMLRDAGFEAVIDHGQRGVRFLGDVTSFRASVSGS